MVFTLLVYNGILVFALFFAYLQEKVNNESQRNLCRFFVFCILWLPATIRYGIGTDYMSYKDIYLGNTYDSLEFGFLSMVQILSYLGCSYFIYFALFAALTYLPITHGIKRQDYLFAICFFILTFYFQTYSIIRQALAVSIICYAVVCYNNNHTIRYFIFVFVGALFHASALLMIPLFVLTRVKLNSIYLLFILFISTIFIFKLNLTESILNSPLLLETQYASYASGQFAQETELGSGLGILLNLLLPFSVILFREKILLLNMKYNFLVNLCVFYILAYILAANIHIFNRLLDLVKFVPILVAPLLFSVFRGRFRVLFIFFYILVSLVIFERAIFVNNITNGSGLGISPYITIFDK